MCPCSTSTMAIHKRTRWDDICTIQSSEYDPTAMNCSPSYSKPHHTNLVQPSIGTAQESIGGHFCPNCTDGEYADTPGTIRCKICDPGRHANKQTGYIICPFCVPGQYQDQPGNADCSKCHSGTASNATGLTKPQCHDCPLGRYADRDGMEECTPCEAGRYNIHAKRTVCDKCAWGRASNVTERKTHCDTCEPGRFAAEFGWVECELCPLGAWGSVMGYKLTVQSVFIALKPLTTALVLEIVSCLCAHLLVSC